MIDQIPPVELPKLNPIVEQVYEKKDYKDMKTFKTKEDAESYRGVNGGYVVKQYDGRFVVIYIPKKD